MESILTGRLTIIIMCRGYKCVVRKLSVKRIMQTASDCCLKISQWIASSVKYVFFHVHPKSNKKIDYNRRTHCKKRNIDKIFTDSRGCNANTFANGCTNTKNLPFNKEFNAIHAANLVKYKFRPYRIFYDF